ncbi:MAG: DUF1385 domain-containing protein [Thermodesulfovibrionales bacterium]|nr:DUF1385 domain-containing protein [Thermodesulfovibrionales bacterium]
MENFGGQALIEGVMMKSATCWTVAVRTPSGNIELKKENTKEMPPFLKLPIIRGVVALVEALKIGIKAIEFSGSVAFEEEDKKDESPWAFAASIVVALLLAIALFKFLPLYLTTLSASILPMVNENYLVFNLIDGLLRVAFFLLYIFCIGLWGEMRKIYQYHGAEHKAIFTYEAGEPLTVENARKYAPFHPRCGTSFLLIVMVISILVFFLIPQHWSFTEKLFSRLLLVPLIAGVSYEILKMSAKNKDNPFVRIAVMPGLFLQRLTVREPNDAQIEVALKALSEVIAMNKDNKEATLKNVR